MNINNSEELEKVIIELEKRKVVQEQNLRDALKATRESFRPINLIKTTVQEITHTPEIRESAIKTAAGIGIGLLTKDMFLGRAIPVLQKLLGSAIQSGVQDGVRSTSNTVTAVGTAIINQLFRKKKTTATNTTNPV
jgi:phosphoenolpyruvate carboxylase